MFSPALTVQVKRLVNVASLSHPNVSDAILCPSFAMNPQEILAVANSDTVLAFVAEQFIHFV